MLKFLKRNKTFTLCVILTVIFFVFGICFNAIIGREAREEIALNINNMISMIGKESTSMKNLFGIITSNMITTCIIWLLGMAVVGIPIVLFFYLFKVFMFSFEGVALLSNLHFSKILFIIIYSLPSLLNIIIYFILVYYCINYSLFLIKLLFFKKSFNIRDITKRYIKILQISCIILVHLQFLRFSKKKKGMLF